MANEKGLPVVRLNTEHAKRLADIAGIHEDLKFTVQVCERLFNLNENSDEDGLLKEALWAAALVSYVRCFAEGKRYGLSEDTLQAAGDKAFEVHRHFVNLRNKHIAHSVNPFEQVEVGVVLSEPNRKERKVERVVTFGLKLVSMNKPAVQGLLTLAATLLDEIKAQARELEEVVHSEASQIPYDELVQYPPLRIRAPHAGDTDRVRSNQDGLDLDSKSTTST